MANLIERPFMLAHNLLDDPNALVAAIRRRTECIKRELDIDGPFTLQIPREWVDRLFGPYGGVSGGMMLVDRILQEKINGLEFMSHDRMFSIVWRMPDIRRRV